MDQQELKKNKKRKQKDSKDSSTKTGVTLLYVRSMPETLSWVFHIHGVVTWHWWSSPMTLKRMLVHQGMGRHCRQMWVWCAGSLAMICLVWIQERQREGVLGEREYKRDVTAKGVRGMREVMITRAHSMGGGWGAPLAANFVRQAAGEQDIIVCKWCIHMHWWCQQTKVSTINLQLLIFQFSIL